MIQSIARTYPFLNGYGRIANLPWIQRMVDRGSEATIRGALRNGCSFTAPAHDHVGRAAWLFGDLDPKLTRLASLIIRKGDHVVDIGAHFGLFSLYAAEMVGRMGRVDAVEPQPRLAGMLRSSLKENHQSHVSVHETALGALDRVMTLSIPDDNSGAASVVRRREGDARLPVVVEQSGPFLEDLSDGPIRFLKMDVEGFESEVIRGALKFFHHRKPDVVFFEAQHNRRYDDNAAVSLLTECGYTCYPVLPSLRRIRLASPDFTGSLDGVHDVVAIASGVVGKDIVAGLKANRVVFV